jgi:predicted nucleic acid-binding protein
MVSPKHHRRIFLDSSVLYAAAFSPTVPARRLLLKGLQERVTLCISDLVLEETKRNLTQNAPLALPSYDLLAPLISPVIIRPTKAEVLSHAQAIDQAYGITVIAPAELLNILTN